MHNYVLAFIFSILVSAIAFGWVIDRQRLQNKIEQLVSERDVAVDTAIGVTSSSTRTRCHILAERHAQKFPGELRKVIQKNLLEDITQVWKRQEIINADEPGEAYNLAHDALVLLKIDSVDQFMQNCKKRFNDAKWWPEFHDENHVDYHSIRGFISESLNPKYATEWGW